MKRFWDERTLYLLLSGGIALVMWLYVATAQNPVVARSLKVDIELRNLEPNEVVVRPSPKSPPQITVRLQGPRSQIALLTPKLVDAYVDLSGLEPGEHTEVPVIVSSALDVRVVDQKPSALLSTPRPRGWRWGAPAPCRRPSPSADHRGRWPRCGTRSCTSIRRPCASRSWPPCRWCPPTRRARW
ncbi:MAG: hypothetical protein E6H03_02175 [Bacillati bacterium ANGP1]|uniref:YbbR-like domain-containing protein n=1 Tax=Candidatus Segetimicrobium genomatis TaxID=2569760 RepID=A0A537JL77_9BACT|nr:MAG: hypothetical protein E6H03_02175 [Terrabacteria group bacterium ANGP1]